MAKVALFGAGGKMGCRLTDNLMRSEYALACVEPSEAGRRNLADRGLEAVAPDAALQDADFVILAVPDVALERVSAEVVPGMRRGSVLVTLDPAAAHAGVIARREGVPLFVTHPCHPPLWREENDPEALRDFFGGIKASQPIVCAIEGGSDEDYASAERLARTMYAPVSRSHRVTVEQMAILEPAMAETVTACCCTIIREAMDEAIRRGVPEAAARDFMMGHVSIPLAIVFGEIGSPFSDGAKRIIEYGRKRLIQPDWKALFEPESVLDQVRTIVRGGTP
ncbi:MAG: NAD(P)-binding domain-containing protein [Fimbriimonadales bacterium]|nr:NAD(P)-binding domain-containing protein [Fimbriimonadales bacterium]